MYILVKDNDAHYFVIPYNELQKWDAWRNLDPDDEKSWDVPDFAEEVGGSPSLVRFESYKIMRD